MALICFRDLTVECGNRDSHFLTFIEIKYLPGLSENSIWIIQVMNAIMIGNAAWCLYKTLNPPDNKPINPPTKDSLKDAMSPSSHSGQPSKHNIIQETPTKRESLSTLSIFHTPKQSSNQSFVTPKTASSKTGASVTSWKTPITPKTPTSYWDANLFATPSSARRTRDSVKDMASLKSLLNSGEKASPTSFLAETPSFSTPMPSPVGRTPVSIRKYHVANQKTPAIESDGIDHCVEGFNYKDPRSVLEEYHADLYIDIWTENLRRWFSKKILQPLAENINTHYNITKSQGAIYLSTSSQAQSSSRGFFSNFRLSQLATSQNPMSGQQQKPQEFMVMEKFIAMPGFSCFDYIIKRINELAKGSQLAGYTWESGGHHLDGRPWNKELPSDALLLFHLFCTFMDLSIPGDYTSAGNPFSSKWVVGSDSKPDTKNFLRIKLMSKCPPHFSLLHGKTCLDVYGKRNNLFHTLCLFIKNVADDRAGYLGLLNLGSSNIDLVSVVS